MDGLNFNLPSTLLHVHWKPNCVDEQRHKGIQVNKWKLGQLWLMIESVFFIYAENADLIYILRTYTGNGQLSTHECEYESEA